MYETSPYKVLRTRFNLVVWSVPLSQRLPRKQQRITASETYSLSCCYGKFFPSSDQSAGSIRQRADVGVGVLKPCSFLPELQVQVHPARVSNMFASGETVFLNCVARGCAAAGKTFALYRNGVNLGYSDKVSPIYNFNSQHAGSYYCRPVPPQNVQSASVSVNVGRKSHAYVQLTFQHLSCYN